MAAPTKENPSVPETPAPAPTYQRIDLDTLPRRNAGPKVDMAASAALMAMIVESPAEQGITDGIAYTTAELARTAGLRASRLAAHSVPAGKVASIRTGEVDGGWAFALTLKDAKASK